MPGWETKDMSKGQVMKSFVYYGNRFVSSKMAIGNLLLG